MTSERRFAANRLNARKSCGPYSAAGKSTASRNALRHGFAALTLERTASSSEVERFAKCLCGSDDDPALFKQAVVIATNMMVLRAISAQQLAIVERLREPSAIALARGDNSLKLARARSRKGRKAWDDAVELRDMLLARYKNELPPPMFSKEEEEMLIPEIETLIPPHLRKFLEKKERKLLLEAARQGNATFSLKQRLNERGEHEAFREATLDLVRLDRYERRAWSRQKRAVFAFMNLKLMQQHSHE